MFSLASICSTIPSDILIDNPYNEALYDQVIHACGLRQDIEALPRRDMTKLGDKGMETTRRTLIQ